LIFFTGINS